jgi:hypothetical protein
MFNIVKMYIVANIAIAHSIASQHAKHVGAIEATPLAVARGS